MRGLIFATGSVVYVFFLLLAEASSDPGRTLYFIIFFPIVLLALVILDAIVHNY